jgi:hypothetical protein
MEKPRIENQKLRTNLKTKRQVRKWIGKEFRKGKIDVENLESELEMERALMMNDIRLIYMP